MSFIWCCVHTNARVCDVLAHADYSIPPPPLPGNHVPLTNEKHTPLQLRIAQVDYLVLDKELALVRRLALCIAQQTGLSPPAQATKTTIRTSTSHAGPADGGAGGVRPGTPSGGTPSPSMAARSGGRRKQAVPSAAPTGTSLPPTAGGGAGAGAGAAAGGVPPRVSPKAPARPTAAVMATAGPPSPPGPPAGSGETTSPTNQSSMSVLQARFYAKLREMRGGPGEGGQEDAGGVSRAREESGGSGE